ncbi:MAG: hypothetical protein ACFCUO_05840 [Rhodospirillales bacterium]
MPDTLEYPAIAGDAGTPSAMTENSGPQAAFGDPAALVDLVHRQSLVTLEDSQRVWRLAAERTQAWIDCAGVWSGGCAALARESVQTATGSLRMAIEDSLKLARLWADLWFKASTIGAGGKPAD